MFCPQCGKELQEGEICSCQQPQPQVQPEAETETSAWKGNEKLFSILSYIGILWLIGMLVNPEKTDSKVRFHVGQGIILSIADVAVGIVSAILNAIIRGIFRTEVTFLGYGTGVYTVSTIGTVLTTLISLAGTAAIIFLLVKGILNVTQNKQEPLPVIGNLAFYK